MKHCDSSDLKPALTIQLIHIALSIVWNIAGVVLVCAGKQALGPTSSLLMAGILVVLGWSLWFSARHLWLLYAVISLVQLTGALSTIVNAFIKDSALWPSPFWHHTGIVINIFGLIGAVWGIYLLLLKLSNDTKMRAQNKKTP